MSFLDRPWVQRFRRRPQVTNPKGLSSGSGKKSDQGNSRMNRFTKAGDAFVSHPHGPIVVIHGCPCSSGWWSPQQWIPALATAFVTTAVTMLPSALAAI